MSDRIVVLANDSMPALAHLALTVLRDRGRRSAKQLAHELDVTEPEAYQALVQLNDRDLVAVENLHRGWRESTGRECVWRAA